MNIKKLEEEHNMIIARKSISKDPETQTNPQIFKCDQCEAAFKNSYEMEEHMRESYGRESQYNCDLCKSTFLIKW